MISLLAAAAALSPKLVSLHDFALGRRCRLGSQLVSLRESPDSWKLWGLLLLNGWVPDCGNRTLSQACFPSRFCSWMSLPCPMISLPGLLLAAACRLAPQAYKSPFLIILFRHDFPFLFWAALDCCLVFQLVSFHAFPSQLVIIGCR